MTACFKLMRTLEQRARLHPATLCTPCVYFSKNLDGAEFPVLMERPEQCGLGFRPCDPGCSEMRTDNCSTRRK
jgi:hypothetical protein